MKKLLFTLFTIFTIFTLSCTTTNTSTSIDEQRLQSLAQLAGIAASVYFPETQSLNAVCTVSGLRDKELMTAALKALWTDANQQQNEAASSAILSLIGTSQQTTTEQQLSEMQRYLGTICCAAGKCVK